jgi:cutinase
MFAASLTPHCILTNDSQGAAVVHRAIESLSSTIMNQIKGVVTFGDTQNKADGGRIPNFPTNKLKVFCGDSVRDQVCDGNLGAAILAPHLSYGQDAAAAGAFLVGRVNAA